MKPSLPPPKQGKHSVRLTMTSIRNAPEPSRTSEPDATTSNSTMAAMSRKEKRKILKKLKRKQRRIARALKLREEEEALANDPHEQMRLLRLEQEEAERMESDRREFEERERRFLEELELKRKREEEEEENRRRLSEETSKSGNNDNPNEDDDWEYIEEGPAEIIWKGNEIIVKKKQVKVRKKCSDPHIITQETDRPTSNPLAPQSEAFEDYKSAQEVLDSVKHEVPNFGTEQDKAHCPFHLKTGVCRFGARCSRVHFYPDKSNTLLMKNMYNGPGLACEQDEGLECTDEEIEHAFEDFYEDVHTEFLKLGEIVNFKVCKNSSSHLRGNVYVHYKSLESAVLAYQSINGRYFAGKQISCEFVNVTRWKVAICGEYMRSRFKTCSRGTACNFIHCFRNPGGDYEWADWDKPAPRYWLKKMAALFGYSADSVAEEVSPRKLRSRGPDSAHGKAYSDEDDCWKGEHYRRHKAESRDRISRFEEELYEHRTTGTVDISDGSSDERKSYSYRNRSRKRETDSELIRRPSKIRKCETKSDCRTKDKIDTFDPREHSQAERRHDKHHDKHLKRKSKHSESRKEETDSSDVDYCEDKHERDRVRHRHHSPSKRRSRHTKYEEKTDSSDVDYCEDRHERDRVRHRHRSPHKRRSRPMKYEEANSSDSASDSNIDRDVSRYRKDGRSARSKNESDDDDDDDGINRKGHERDDRYHRHRRRSSRPHNEDSGLSNVNSNGESRFDLERSHRLAALKKLEELKKSKESQPLHNSRYVESERNSHDSHSVVVQDQEVSKDLRELSDSRKTETMARRRI